MARTASRPTAPRPASPAPESTSWSQWPAKLQAFQVHAALDGLGVFSRYVAALAASRDVAAIGQAQQALAGDWVACIEGVQRRWAELGGSLPPPALAALGWRLKRGTGGAADDAADESLPSLVEQSRLGFEMLLRPWMEPPDLAHTDEFVA
jgi:hypothetical protein